MGISNTTYAILFAAIVLEAFGSSFLEKSNGMKLIVPVIISLACYGGSFFFGAIVLRTMPIGVMYAVWCGVGVVAAAAIGYYVNKQSLDLPTFLGMGLIAAGVVVIYLYSKNLSA